ncbi:hypothetical protein BCR33DRAFT_761128 [Rhizoclosmatium globosum]|uniref:GH3 middle domain-containing protein n=1 Tax=Rhizoclosmatium globosum TaxID=329046 RepID=A0A1Y2D3F7_9FUNG|nr:hypothetical protein BCR33DRAFT_761128 [Rhizoclosmatium globosum]|eukprot:ORY53812.1 hypothetical protein BCR33DRAFT_761128 [Rhizoclosmatium globosum]
MLKKTTTTTTTTSAGAKTVIKKEIKTTFESAAAVALRLHLTNQRRGVISDFVTTLNVTEFYRTAPALAAFRQYLETNTSPTPAELEEAFTNLIPITTFEDYKQFLDRIITGGDRETPDLLFPGIANYIINSSSTSGGKPKLFPVVTTDDIGKQMLEVHKMKLRHLAAGIDFDTKVENGVPLAVKLIKHYPSLLILHALYGLMDQNVGYIGSVFSSTVLDWIHTIQDHKDELLDCIEKGTLPQGLVFDEGLEDAIKSSWSANPSRAQELKQINFSQESWMKAVWPKLQSVEAGCGGPFAAGIPKIRFAIGPSVKIVFGVYGCTEGFVVGISLQDANNPNLFQIPNFGVVFEYLETRGNKALISVAELKQGERYQLVVSNKSLGIWRYFLGDIVEFVGFHPATKNPIIQYIGRDGGIRLVPCLVTESEILKAAQAVFDQVKDEIKGEFTSFADILGGRETITFCFERKPDSIVSVSGLEDVLTSVLRQENTVFDAEFEGKLRKCVIHFLSPGSFSKYRSWKAETVGSGQVKIPIVASNLEVRDWFLAHCL